PAFLVGHGANSGAHCPTIHVCFIATARPPASLTLFPYTTLFRSQPGPKAPHDTGKVALRAQDRLEVRHREQHRLLRLTAERLPRSEEHTSELQSRFDLVCRLLLEKKKHHLRSFMLMTFWI